MPLQLAWKTGQFRVLPKFGPGGWAQHKCDTRTVNHAVINAYTAVFCPLDMDFCFSSPDLQAIKIDNIRSMICRKIQATGMDQVMAWHHNDPGVYSEDLLEYVLEDLIEQPINSFNRPSSFVAATAVSMLFSAVLPMGRSAIPCSYSNSNDITNNTRVENGGLVDGSTIGEGVMSLRG